MKRKHFLLIALSTVFVASVMFFQSCTNDVLEEVDTVNENEQVGAGFELEDIRFQDGMMVFDQLCDLNAAATLLANDGFQKMSEYEQEGFHSLKAKLEKSLFDSYSDKSIVSTNAFIVEGENGFHHIDFPFYFLSAVLNEDGMVIVDGKYIRFTENYIYSLSEDAYTTVGDWTQIASSDEEKGIFVSPVEIHVSTHDKINEVGGEPILSSRNCSGSDMGILQEGSTSCEVDGRVMNIRVSSIATRIEITPGNFLYCGRSEALVQTLHNGNPLLSDVTVHGFLQAEYWAGQQHQTLLEWFNQTQYNSSQHTFVFWEATQAAGNNSCWDADQCFEYSPFGSNGRYGLNSWDPSAGYPNWSFTPSNAHFSADFGMPASIECDLKF